MRKLCLILFAIFCLGCEAKHFATTCDLVHELRSQGFPEDKMRDWVCLVEHESSRYTHPVSRVNRDGSRDYGLFQINNRYWCSTTSTPGGDCNVTCAELHTDDITKAAKCAKKVYRRHKFGAWNGWKDHCRGKTLPDISSC